MGVFSSDVNWYRQTLALLLHWHLQSSFLCIANRGFIWYLEMLLKSEQQE